MFGSKKAETDSTGKQSSGLTVNLLSSGSVFEGKTQTENDIRIDGVFKGQLTCKARLIIGPTGQFDGDCQCINAVVEGSFQGRMKVHETLEVREHGKVKGEIQTKKLIVQSGAVFEVQCDMGTKSVPLPDPTKDKSRLETGAVNA
jgi:cytoskeletal protein CcmA (bactofilin family)